MAVRGVVLVLLLVSGLLAPAAPALPTTAGATVVPAAAAAQMPASASRASGGVVASRPRARISGSYVVLSSGKVRVTVRSNAAKVRLTYNSPRHRTVVTALTLRRGTATTTLSKGSQSIRAQAQATRRLRASAILVLPRADTTAPRRVSHLSVSATAASTIGLAWTNPNDRDLASVIVRRATGTTPPASPTQGTGVRLPAPRATSVTDTGLPPNTGYAYSVFTRDRAGNTSRPATVTTRTSPTPNPTLVPVVKGWVTLADGSQKLAAVVERRFTAGRGSGTPIDVDHATLFQAFEGAGAAMTDSSAWLLQSLPADRRDKAMADLFGAGGAGLSYLRVPFGASDFALSDYTYNDLPSGSTDEQLRHFSIAHDQAYLIPALRKARELNPGLRFMATPWSPPAWMKTPPTLNGGTLNPRFRQALADYLVRAVREYAASGVPIDTLTPQNEPQHEPSSYPSMRMSAEEQAVFVRDFLGPSLQRAGLRTRLLIHDHNWDLTNSPLTVLRDPQARSFVDGVAFHCYGGQPSAQSSIRARYPQQGVWFTECSGGGWATDFGANLAWNVRNLAIANFRNWGRSMLLWNLALDPEGGPKNGGCNDCRGVITINPATAAVQRNEEYYALSHVTRFIRPGARRIDSTDYGPGGPENVAFRNPDGSIVLLVHTSTTSNFTVNWDGKHVAYGLPAGATLTLHWQAGLPPMPAETGPAPDVLQPFEAEGSHYAAHQTATSLTDTIARHGTSSLRSHSDSGTWHSAGLYPINAPVNLRGATRLCLWIHEDAQQTGNTLGLRLIDHTGANQELWSDHPTVGTNPLTQRHTWVEMCFNTSAFTEVDLSSIDRIQLTTYWPGTYHYDSVTANP